MSSAVVDRTAVPPPLIAGSVRCLSPTEEEGYQPLVLIGHARKEREQKRVFASAHRRGMDAICSKRRMFLWLFAPLGTHPPYVHMQLVH